MSRTKLGGVILALAAAAAASALLTGGAATTTRATSSRSAVRSSIVGFQPGVTRSAAVELLRSRGAARIRFLGGSAPLFSADLDSTDSLRGLRQVHFISRNGSFQRTAPAPTNEPQLPDFWWLQPPSNPGGVGIDAVDAWGVSTGNNVVVAVLDSGIDLSHPDLAANLWTNPNEVAANGLDDDNDGYIDDVHGADMLTHSGDPTGEFWHGTHAAGIIAAVGNNGVGSVGVAYGAKIMAVKVMDDNGQVSYDNAVAGIYYAIKHGAKIINLSWGGYDTTPALYQALVDAGKAGVLVVCAAGNDTKNNDKTPVYPASYNLPNMISVAATTANGALANFSNYGKAKVDIAAPGDKIASTYPGDQYAYASGTSMAAPVVSGIAALLLQIDPAASPGQLKRAILGGADYVPSFGATIYSSGRADAMGAINALEHPDFTPPTLFRRRLPLHTAFKLKRRRRWTNEQFSWTAASDPELAGYDLIVDGKLKEALSPTATRAVVELPPGRHTWTVVAFDRSTNERSIR